MAKKLQEWLDEFIENGFSSDVGHWPEEGSVETNQPSVNITPSTSAQTILPDEGYIGFDQAVVAAVDNTIDNNIQAGNIKKNVTILGVTGNYEAPEVPAYAGPYTITENGAIAISGKQATQDISVEVPSPTYDSGVYYANNNQLVAQNLDNGYWYYYNEPSYPGQAFGGRTEFDDNRIYFHVNDDNFITNENGDSGAGVYVVRYDEGRDSYIVTQAGSSFDTIYIPSEDYGLTTIVTWTYSGSNVLYSFYGSGSAHPAAGLCVIGVGGEYEYVDLPNNDLQGEYFEYDNEDYYIFKGIGSGLYDGANFATDHSLIEVTTGVEDDQIYWKENGNWNNEYFANGAIKYRDYDNDSIYNLGSWGGSGIYQVEENNTTIIELEVNESTEVTIDGKTYTITRTV